MNTRSKGFRVLLDEGVPTSVGEVLEVAGHEVIPFEDAVKRGARDELVCAAAEANNAVLVAFDNDMKQAARRHGVTGGRFKKLSLVKFTCPEPMAAKRLREALSFIEHEWSMSETKASRRMFVEIGKHYLRSNR